MERNRRLEAPLPAGASVACTNELNGSNSDVSSLTAENCKDALRASVDVNPDDHKAWTDEKHNLYLNHLEVSFVKQLHQSKVLLMQHSEPNQRSFNASQKRPVNVHNVSEQFTVLRNGRWQKINYERDQPLSRSSADSCNPCKSPWISHLKGTEVHCPASAAARQQVHRKGIISHGLAACSQQFSAKNTITEGVGQNFVEEENPHKSNIKSQAKRMKTALADVSCYDQIVPSTKCPGEEHREFVSDNF